MQSEPIPTRDQQHEGIPQRLEDRGRDRTDPPNAIPNPISPPPQPTGRTENPSSCPFYSCHRREGTDRRGRHPRAPVDKGANVPSSDGAAGALENETIDNFLLYGGLGWSGSPWTVSG